jgi:tetratricopeptide (TPR) repeat protein
MATKKVKVHRFEKKKAASAEPRKSESKADSKTLPFEVDPRKLEESLNSLKDRVVKLAKKGRYTKVRFKFRGKQLLPDLPFAAVAAFEGLTFYWAGLLRLLVFNLAGRTVLEVELVNDSENRIQKGKEALLSGELDAALKWFQEAFDMDPDNAHVHLNLGIAKKLKGDLAAARTAFERAKALDPKGPTGAEAERLLGGLGGGTVAPS